MRRFLTRFILLTLLAGVAGGYWLWQHYQGFLQTPLNMPSDGVVWAVAPGNSVATIARQLQGQGLLSDARLFRWYVRSKGQGAQVKSGEFQLHPGMTPVTLLQLLVAGKTINYSITLVEGWNFKEMMAHINKSPFLEHTLSALNADEIMQQLGREGAHSEGRFFPDTYYFPKNTSDKDLLLRAAKRMQDILTAAWSDKAEKLPLKNAYEALILASIIEKETGVVRERPEIAGVFSRRLKKGMRLQTDPTVIYGMGDRYKGNIRRKDLREKTPYNTYVIKRLPPTPICMPGAQAIQAAVQPQAGKSLYFVAKGDGSHQFSATLKQHNAAVRKYQLKQ